MGRHPLSIDVGVRSSSRARTRQYLVKMFRAGLCARVSANGQQALAIQNGAMRESGSVVLDTIEAWPNLMHRTILMRLYATGIRARKQHCCERRRQRERAMEASDYVDLIRASIILGDFDLSLPE